jgi:hypothetical protein
MGMTGSPDIFQEKMSSLMRTLEYLRVYLDDLLIISKDTYEDHMSKLRQVLEKLKQAGLRINSDKSFFARDKVEYLGYFLSRKGIRPMKEKVSAI